MKNILTVFGATGQQGGSVIEFVLNDALLSKEYQVRAVTRDIHSAKSASLSSRGVEVVQGDPTDAVSVRKAVRGSHAVFAITVQSFGPSPKQEEVAAGKAIADAAVAESVQFLIFSTLPPVTKLSGGKFTKVSGWDAKAEVEEYIRHLPLKYAFFAPGSFMQNFQSVSAPHWDGQGFVLARPVAPTARLPLIDIARDTGKFVGAVLAEPSKFQGKTFCAAVKHYTMEEICSILSKKSGKPVRYVQVSVEDFKKAVGQYVGAYSETLAEMICYQEEFGYYGPESQRLVEWAVQNARSVPNTLEEYIDAHPIAALE